MPQNRQSWEVVILGGGVAGLSAAIYLGRAKRRTLIVDAGQSLARWEPDVENYLGFTDGIAGEELLRRGQEQARRYEVQFITDEIQDASRDRELFVLHSERSEYRAGRVLVATGLFHLPPEIPHVSECLGHSMFFCKDCDGWRVQGKRVAIVGHNNEAVEYALGMVLYSPCVVVATNGKTPFWDDQHGKWLQEYEIPVFDAHILNVEHDCNMLKELIFADGQKVFIDALFTTRGDIFHNRIAKDLGAEVDAEGQIKVDDLMRTSVRGLYAAGCVTPANCQMIIAAGEGATAAQAINRDLFQESLRTHQLRRFREKQIRNEQTEPEVKAQ
jgi:thioredoxin reductase (NADPH)